MSLKTEGVTDTEIAELYDIAEETVTRAVEMIRQHEDGILLEELVPQLQPKKDDILISILDSLYE